MSNSLDTAIQAMKPAPAVDPFEESLTVASQRLDALKAVKLAQLHLRETRERAHKNIEAAEIGVTNAMIAASRIKAYDVLPVDQRPQLPDAVVSAAAVAS